MARYTAVFSTVWDDMNDKGLGLIERTIYLYLITSKHLNSIGLYRLPIGYASTDIGITPEEYQRGIDTVSKRYRIQYDKASQTVFIGNYLKLNPISNEKQAKGCARVARDYVNNPLYAVFYNRVKELYPQYIGLFDTPSKPIRYGMDTLSDGYRSPTEEQDQDQDQKHDDDDDRRAPAHACEDPEQPNEFLPSEIAFKMQKVFGTACTEEMYSALWQAWDYIRRGNEENAVPLILKALEQTAYHGGKSVQYTLDVLRQWDINNLRSPMDVDDHENKRNQSKGRC